MVLLLFLVKGVPETMENLDIIFNMLNLESLEYTITGDFKFLMPCFGLLSCNAVHPCLNCNGERRKGKWSSGLLEGLRQIHQVGLKLEVKSQLCGPLNLRAV